MPDFRRPQVQVACLLGALFAWELVVTAWLSDDAELTIRTVLNLLHGHGARFNVDERVQAYTHPLWFLGLAGLSAAIGNVFAAAFVLPIAVSLTTLVLLAGRVSRSTLHAALVGTALLLSKAFVDFSTSGLENPLAHLLLVLLLAAALRALDGGTNRDTALAWMLGGLGFLTRPDFVLLVAPMLVLVLVRTLDSNRARLRVLALAAAPVLAWSAFSLAYYGFALPNTAYAKLGTGVPLVERIPQGIRYLEHTWSQGPLTLAVIVLGVVSGSLGGPAGRAVAVGLVAHVAYVVSIGGDFMAGRFFTAPLVAATILLATTASRRILAALGVLVVVLGLPALPSTLLSGPDYADQTISAAGITDERGYFFQRYGLVTAPAGTFVSPSWSVGRRDVKVACGEIGVLGVIDGPGVHYVDQCGLADPLLARLPAIVDPDWRIGHHYRALPDGYLDSIAKDANLLTDPAHAAYYDALRLVTRAPLFAPGRWEAIARLNLGLLTPPR